MIKNTNENIEYLAKITKKNVPIDQVNGQRDLRFLSIYIWKLANTQQRSSKL